MGDKKDNGMHPAEVELIANRVSAETAKNMMAQLPAAMAPQMYEVAEKVSKTTSDAFRATLT